MSNEDIISQLEGLNPHTKEEKLYQQHARLIASRARRIKLSHIDREDLVSAALEGFHKAIKSYDPQRGAFTNHAVHCMDRTIDDLLRLESGVHISPNAREEIGKIARGEEGTMPEEKVRKLRETTQTLLAHQSLDVIIEGMDSGETLAGIIPDTKSTDDYLEAETRADLEQAIRREHFRGNELRYLNIVYQALSKDIPIAEIAGRHGFSRSRVHEGFGKISENLRQSPCLKNYP